MSRRTLVTAETRPWQATSRFQVPIYAYMPLALTIVHSLFVTVRAFVARSIFRWAVRGTTWWLVRMF